uniref:Uncharacterized protein n=1 Tax=Anopheles dirus TaxID=7168 RepID=A0A182NXX1_9DIPT
MAKITNYSIPDTSSPVRELNIESDRLQTFTGWPVPYIRPADLARWGFYYTKRRDIVQCYFCTVELGDWRSHDVVEREHLQWSRYCPLLTGRATNNVPIDRNFVARISDIVPDEYGSGHSAGAVSNGSSESINQPNVTEPSPAEAGSSSQGAALLKDAVKTYKAKHPKYATE